MWCARWGCVLALALAERVHVVEQVPDLVENLPELKCELVAGDYQVPKEGLKLETCTFGAVDLKVHLLGPLTVRGNVTVLGNLTLLGRGISKKRAFQQACFTIGGTLSVSGSLVVKNCYNNGVGDRAHGGCLNASDLVLQEGLLGLENCKTSGHGAGASLGTLLQRGGELNFSECDAQMDGGGLNARSLDMEGGLLNFKTCVAQGGGGARLETLHQRAGKASFIQCAARGEGGGLAARRLMQEGAMRFEDSFAGHGGGAHVTDLITSGNLSFEGCRAQTGGGGGGYARRLTQSESGQLICRNCVAESGGCLLVETKVALLGVLKASSVAAPRGSVLRTRGPDLSQLQRLEIQGAQGIALDGDAMNISELALGPSEVPFRLKARSLFLDSANCSAMEECTFQLHKQAGHHRIDKDIQENVIQHEKWMSLVRPLCRRGSGLVEEELAGREGKHFDAVEASLTRGCRRCPAGLAQLRQGEWATCGCPRGWTCAPEKMQMPSGAMPLNLSDLGRLSRCLSSSACPGGQLPENVSQPWCAPGHLGPLCAVCADRFYRAKGGCEICAEASDQGQQSLWAMAAVLGIAAVLVAVAAWLVRGRVEQRWKKAHARWHVLVDLAARQAGVLLQLAQLYAVLGTLVEDPLTSEGSQRELWERKYMDVMQLNLAQVQDAVRAECLWHGPTVRLASALASPVVPVAMLLACSMLELLKPSLGFSSAFKVLTMFYIGGARQSSDLFRCQEVDAGGDSLGDFAFLQKLPFISCSDTEGTARWVYVTGCGTALFYVCIIPAALMYLFVRQHVILRRSKTVTAVAEKSKTGWLARLQPLEGPNPQDQEHLLAAAVAHMAVALRGQVLLQLRDGQAEMRTAKEEFRTDAELNVSRFLETDDFTTQTLRSRAIMEMLVERCEMERVSKQDRLLAGAKEVFFKYA
ncbi:unnamed protein product, partial [Effrenium voratum]